MGEFCFGLFVIVRKKKICVSKCILPVHFYDVFVWSTFKLSSLVCFNIVEEKSTCVSMQ